MNLLDRFLNKLIPQSREGLLTICAEKMRKGNYEEAVRFAQTYKNRCLDRDDIPDNEKSLNIGCAWYVIGLATYEGIRSRPNWRTYEYFKPFFGTYRMGYTFLQMYFDRCNKYYDNESTSSLSIIRERNCYLSHLDDMYKEMYDKYGEDPDLERADIDVNNELSDIEKNTNNQYTP